MTIHKLEINFETLAYLSLQLKLLRKSCEILNTNQIGLLYLYINLLKPQMLRPIFPGIFR